MSLQEQIRIDLINEGPDAEQLGLVELVVTAAAQLNYDLSKLHVVTSNVVQSPLPINLKITMPMHFVDNTRDRMHYLNKTIKKTFGLFIGRSNVPRLYLSSYLWNHCREQSIQTFHYSTNNDFHKDNLGLDQLINQYGVSAATDVARFLQHTPLHTQEEITYPILMDQHCNLAELYRDFFVEIACETYYSGQTFFPTEKTWRAIATGTPFIIQGPQYYLHRLRDLGFRTFGDYWPEGYAEDPANYQPEEITRIIDQLAKMPANEIESMYQDMQSILAHNSQRLQTLTSQDFESLR